MSEVWTNEEIIAGVDRYAPTLDNDTRQRFIAFVSERWLGDEQGVWNDMSKEWVRFCQWSEVRP